MRELHIVLKVKDVQKPSVVSALVMVLPGVEEVQVIGASTFTLPEYSARETPT